MRHRLTLATLAAALMMAGAAQAQTATAPATPPATTTNDANPAVATNNTDAAQPAKGHNSFTRGEATARLKKHGYAAISGLKKDQDGVWRGSATKDGSPVQVWLDYKGDVGQS